MPRNPPRRHRAASLTLHIGHAELVVRQRYEAASVANDALIAAWFLIGSIMFFSPAWTHTGTWCFVLGSVELMIRPAIRLTRQLHLQRLRGSGDHSGALTASDQDY
ncbi:YrhK family protein [Streptomyces tubbatahanensis]|uniref:YrhK family protein n=1 Tax=Streptomyces tubbatahanensis TaxID=2923272 RepID=A0ABY3XZ66_9ACTN|nr:YrhK family protein [Streptomyces tubbatahanensis]UNS99767.1 YrhK family protein [Streptomyces tubbatahanensis]